MGDTTEVRGAEHKALWSLSVDQGGCDAVGFQKHAAAILFRSRHKLLPQLSKEASLLRKDPDHRSRSDFTHSLLKFQGFKTGSFSSDPGWFGTSPARQLVQRQSVGDARRRSEAELVPLMKPFTQQVMKHLCGVPFSLCLILNFISCSFSRKEKPLRT